VYFLKYLCAVTSQKNIVSIINMLWYVRFVTKVAISICVSIVITISGEEKITRNMLQQHSQFHTRNYMWNGKFHFHVKIILKSLQFFRSSYKHMVVPSDPPVTQLHILTIGYTHIQVHLERNTQKWHIREHNFAEDHISWDVTAQAGKLSLIDLICVSV